MQPSGHILHYLIDPLYYRLERIYAEVIFFHEIRRAPVIVAALRDTDNPVDKPDIPKDKILVLKYGEGLIEPQPGLPDETHLEEFIPDKLEKPLAEERLKKHIIIGKNLGMAERLLCPLMLPGLRIL